jgi:hypothetical protein
MTLVSLSPDDLGRVLTFITGFMCDRSTSFKTYEQLLATYHACKDSSAPYDESKDLRITDYISDMTAGRWRDPSIVIVLGVWEGRVLVMDGIHRGVAYLDRVKGGMSPQDLPPLYLGY